VRGFSTRNPRTGVHDWRGQALDPLEVGDVAARLRDGQAAWEARGAVSRLEVLRAFGQALRRHAESIGTALETDTGRRRIARLEIDSVVGSIEGWARVIAADAPPAWVQGRGLPSVRHTAAWKAYPLVGVISPWNFPLLLGMIDAVPALLAGCAVLVKPSEVTPRFIVPVMAAVAEVPELAAVFAIVTGDGITGQAVVDVADCVCFTGSVATGRKVAVQAAGQLIPAYLELGGKDPLIVLEGADLEAATDAALRGSVLSTGQACQSIERIYVATAAVVGCAPRFSPASLPTWWSCGTKRLVPFCRSSPSTPWTRLCRWPTMGSMASPARSSLPLWTKPRSSAAGWWLGPSV
jgi:acyl-CoA reductase-like NAD-dependent aldehyde dehydrogenase